ncbi:MAG: lipid-A-disaccharide synthase N-terminal domain-containing protein [Planctomycetes bacterium]|nr:lipid-A-disaccharide synthase N-terminal domain-containing protein [Planctomycetota bacterium]
MFGPTVLEHLFEEPPNWLFRILNITSLSSLLWVGIGLLGQVAFFLRMAVQWIASERRKESFVPESFWWLSLGGGIALFSYFIWRKDLIGVLGQTTGVVIYARNLRLIHKRRTRQRTAG